MDPTLQESMGNNPLVTVLMCTYNGQDYIEEQIRSIIDQTHTNLKLVISDDGSIDKTIETIRKVAARSAQTINVRSGPGLGFAKNFLSLAADCTIQGHYFAFSDQDDVWAPEKIQAAIQNIAENEVTSKPYLYCGRTVYADARMNPLGISKVMRRGPSFENSLVQSIAGGNTMVFNKEAKKIIERIGVVDVPSHDWWLYQLVTGHGGTVYYDTRPYVYYRQHNTALIGGNTSVASKVRRFRRLLDGHFHGWMDKNICALEMARDTLTDHACHTLDRFNLARASGPVNRLLICSKSGVFRQSSLETVLMSLACLVKKL
jgi:glycosyltransferase involved in cell wall biosynthesis